MFKRKYLTILLFLIICTCAVSAVSAADLNATDNVIGEEVSDEIAVSNDVNDEIAISDDDLLSSDWGTYKDLYKRIKSNYDKGEVKLYKDYYYDMEIDDGDVTFGSIPIKKDIVIYGNGHTIYCNDVKAFEISSNVNVAIYDLNFIGEYTTADVTSPLLGGAIETYGNVYIENCLFRDCAASSDGGAIYNYGILTVNNCVFFNNYIADDDGDGGAIANYNILLVIDSVFTNNRATYGGAIYTAGYAIVNGTVFGTYVGEDSEGEIRISGTNKAKYGTSIYNKPGKACDAEKCYFNETANSKVEVISDVISTSCVFSNQNNVKGGVLYNYTAKGKMSYPNTLFFTGFSYTATPSIDTYYNSGENIEVIVTSNTGERVSNVGVGFIIDGDETHPKIIATNSEGVAKFSASTLTPGQHTILVGLASDALCTKEVTIPVKIEKVKLSIKVSKLTTTYKSGKKWTIQVTDETNNKPAANIEVKLKVYTGSKTETYTVKTNSEGVATFKASDLNKGYHKVVLSIPGKGYSCPSVESSIKINPKKLYIVGEMNKFKDCTQLILGAYNKDKDKLISGVKLQIKIYTGKKYRTLNLVTKYSKDIGGVGVLLETNAFSSGTHRVTVKITSPNYSGYESDKIVILKSAKKYKKFTYVITNGKGKYV